MKRWIQWIGAIGALFMLFAPCAALAEEMPIVTDEPLTAQEQAAMVTDPNERTRQAQQMLIDLNMLNGKADGVYGRMTMESVLWFQAKYSLEQTGTLNDETFAALVEKSAQAGENRKVQQRLIDLGYLRGTADGIFGDRSKAALRLFQAVQGLEATGEMDAATEAVLYTDGLDTVPSQLNKGDKGDAVVALQQRLIQLCFLNDRPDGNYGPATSAAVKSFQSHLIAQGVDENLGIEATGVATSATLMLLMDPEYSSYVADVSEGTKSAEALRLERRLSQLGYLDLQPDEQFDAYSGQCVAAFSAAAGIGSGTTANKAVVDALFKEDAPVAEHYVLHDIAYKDRGDAVREMEELLVAEGMMIKLPNGRYDDDLQTGVGMVREYLEARNDAGAQLFADPSIMTVAAQEALRSGVLGDARLMDTADASSVKRAQRRLHVLYYLDKSSIDGKLGDETREAISSFQSTNGLEASGELDAATLGALFSDTAIPKRLPYRVEVSIDDQRVYVYELNAQNEYEQTHEFICSTGLGNSTPRGIFLDGYPANVWHHFVKFKCWAKYSFEVEGNIMLHSVIYSEPKESTLRESSLYGLGQKASHGCIRLKVADAKWLFNHCKRGTLVIVIY